LEGSGLSKLKLRRGEAEIELERRLEVVQSMHVPVAVEQAAARPAVPSPGVAVPAAEETGRFVTSPIVGSFYRSPSPEADPFVEVGDTVDADTVVCLVEAMKVMNEVKAGVKGVIKEVLVENGHPVEFASKLFRIG
jgi:acetyl-CoA carboxylase biotin carboxyl carrier protein